MKNTHDWILSDCAEGEVANGGWNKFLRRLFIGIHHVFNCRAIGRIDVVSGRHTGITMPLMCLCN
jgi:hypothetical protein